MENLALFVCFVEITKIKLGKLACYGKIYFATPRVFLFGLKKKN